MNQAVSSRDTALDEAAAWSDEPSVSKAVSALDAAWTDVTQKVTELKDHLGQLQAAETQGVAEECLAAAERVLTIVSTTVDDVCRCCSAVETATEAAAEEAAGGGAP